MWIVATVFNSKLYLIICIVPELLFSWLSAFFLEWSLGLSVDYREQIGGEITKE